MLILKTTKGYFVANHATGVFDTPVENYNPNEEDTMLDIDF